MSNAKDMLSDEREVVAIGASILDNPDWQVGKYNVTKIEMYAQSALYCDVPWFAVYVGDEIVARVNGLELAIVRYK